MVSRHHLFRALSMLTIGAVGALTGAGCESGNPNATNVEKPILTEGAPKSSEEAAQQAEPAPAATKGPKKAR